MSPDLMSPAAALVFSKMSVAMGCSISRPPRPAMKPTIGVRFGDDVVRLPHGLVVLHADLHEPVLIHLWRDRDRVVRMQETVAEIELWKELIDRRLRRELHDLLGVGEERAIEPDRDGQRD